MRHMVAMLFALILLPVSSAIGVADDRVKPQRIVSLNLCTDQIVMMLVPPDRIAAISRLSLDANMSVMAHQAQSLTVTSGLAEEILTLKPDLVIAGTFTTRPTIALLERLGYRVLEVAPAYSFDEIRKNVAAIARAVGEEEKGRALIDRFDQSLAVYARTLPKVRPVAAAYYASNYTSGSATLVDDIIRAAGFRNLASDMGLRGTARLALEHLITRNPDLVVLGRSRAQYQTVTAENLKHPAFKTMLERVAHVVVPDKLTICGTPHTLQAVERLVGAHGRIAAKANRP